MPTHLRWILVFPALLACSSPEIRDRADSIEQPAEPGPGTEPGRALERSTPEELPHALTETVDQPGAATEVALAYADKHLRWSGPIDAAHFALVIGSSSIYGALGKTIARELTAKGHRVVRLGVSGTGLSRRDRYDWLAVAGRLPVPNITACALVYLGVNDAQTMTVPRAGGVPVLNDDALGGGPLMARKVARRKRRHMAAPRAKGSASLLPSAVSWRSPSWPSAYEDRVVEFVDLLCDRGVPKVMLLLPIDVRPKQLDAALRRVRAAQINAAARSKCGVAIATEGDAPRFFAQKTALRRPDGFHITRAGAQVVWHRIAAVVERAFVVAAER